MSMVAARLHHGVQPCDGAQAATRRVDRREGRRHGQRLADARALDDQVIEAALRGQRSHLLLFTDLVKLI